MDELFLFLFTGVAGTEVFMALCALIFLYFIHQKKWRRAGYFLLTSIGIVSSTALLKALFAVARPSSALIEVTGYAFPSGHAAGSAFLAIFLCALAGRLPKWERYPIYAACILFAVAVGVSRVYFGVHTPLQVFAGFALGAFWALLWFQLTRHSHVR